MRTRGWVFILLILLMGTGCASQKAWVYRPNAYVPEQTDNGKTAVVLPFEDARPNDNTNAVLMYMIPLMPFGWQNLDAPEGVQGHLTSGLWTNYKPTEDYAKALAEEFRKAGLFKEVYFDYRKVNSDYYFKGKIIKTRYDGKLFSYGLSIYGPLLWFIGFPAATTQNELAVELSYVDTISNKTLFTKVYEAKPHSNTAFIYVMGSDFNYAEMLAEVYKRFCEDLMPLVKLSAAQK